MALRLRGSKDVKKSSYYVWYLGAREAKGVDAMPSAIDYLLERERLQEPFKVTLQVSSKGLKIIQTVHHPAASSRSALKHLVPGHAVLATVQREDVVAATLLLPNPASNNPVHVHAYRCDSVETAELLGGQLKALASHSDNLARIASTESRIRSNLGSDGRSTRESESSEGSGELRNIPVQATSIYESLAAELRAKLGRGNSADNTGPILLPPRDYDTVHRQRGNLLGIEFRRCLNQNIVGGNTVIERGGTRSAASSGIGSDSAATPPPYQSHHPLGPRPSRPSRDSSSDDDWGGPADDQDYIPERETSNLTLPRITRSPERVSIPRGVSPASHRNRKPPEHRQRSPSPQYQHRINPGEITSPRERFQDAKEMFRAMEQREAVQRPVVSRQREPEIHMHRLDMTRQAHGDRMSRQFVPTSAPIHEHLIRRSHPELLARENDVSCKAKPRPRTLHYPLARLPEPEVTRTRPRSSYESPPAVRELKGPRNVINTRDIRDFRDRQISRDFRDKLRVRPMGYQELSEHERFPGLDRESARPALEIIPSAGRYRHSYAEPPRLGLAALHPY
ncbi:uncharacterized protein LOC122511236 [Leptopilina heterotoma]|uniref:uncharacterized protein LOC122511236 n=1 Tax=Leptopilina heterotoma TaxID=63436 RepID=UPI001CA9FC39|nr:uncharacterized protein LOC122511236 [Leptopilina heterotoma]XP_043482304.1 uncharacterized protein LOC122511236 [Leptopilina heterotoma]